MDYKYHSKKYALRQKIRWRLELWGALRIMGVTAPSNASFTIMRRTFERGAEARLSFSGGPHAPVSMADSV